MISQWTKDRQQRRAERERDLAAKQIALGKFGVVYASHPLDRLPDAIAKDAILFLRTAPAMTPDALRAMEEWGFTYKSNFMWPNADADWCGWFKTNAERVLVGTRGKIPAPAPGTQSASVIKGPPCVINELIERYFPNMPKIDLSSG
jgi:N6-adenosine-specific RNA methylase IME4